MIGTGTPSNVHPDDLRDDELGGKWRPLPDPDDDRYMFDAAEAESVCQFIERECKHWQGEWAGKPFVLAPYQRRATRDLFGWKHRESRLRLYRRAYVAVPKGNGKTPWGAALSQVGLFWSGEAGAEIYGVAGDRSQARIMYQDAYQMRMQSRALRARSRAFTNRMIDIQTQSFYQVVSSEDSTKHGFRPSMILFDEIHVQKNRRLFDTFQTALVKRPESILAMFTTAGEYDPEALWWTEHEYAMGVIRGEIDDPSYYAVIYAAGEEDDWEDEALWARVNPNIGKSVKLEGLRDEYRKAKHNPVEQARFKQLHLNLAGDSAKSPIPMDCWVKCSAAPEPSGPCYLGVDLSSKLDLNAVAAWWPETNSAQVRFWVPGDGLDERRRRDAFDYPRYVREKHMFSTDGNMIDQRAIRSYVIDELVAKYDVQQVGMDSHNASELFRWFQDEDGLSIVDVPQGSLHLSEPLKLLVGMVKDLTLRHGGCPVLSWCAQNLRVNVDDREKWKPTKRASRKRIDGMVALAIAISRSIAEEGEGGAMLATA